MARETKEKKRGDTMAAAEAPAPAEPVTTLRVRMLRDISCKLGAFALGKSYVLPATTARSWIDFGFAEQDKAHDAAQETK